MNAPAIKTPAEQKLAWLEGLHRPLTDAEGDELRRALHAVYCYPRTHAARAARAEREAVGNALAEHDRDNAALLAKLERERDR